MRLIAVLAAALLLAGPAVGQAAEPVKGVGIAMHGAPKYGAGFAHFDYVNPDAPKGGTVRLDGVSGTFDTFNPFNAKGTVSISSNARDVSTAFDFVIDNPGMYDDNNAASGPRKIVTRGRGLSVAE